MPGCFYLRDALEWAISKGCSHSFHLICLQESTHCPIYRIHLRKVIKKLATTAKDGFMDGGQKEGKETRDDDIKVDNPKITEIMEESIKNGLTEISTRLSVFQPFVPDVPKDVASALNDQSMFSRQNTKQPHCKTCHHQRKGHTCPKGKKIKSICPSCPGNICSTDGRGNPCKCD